MEYYAIRTNRCFSKGYTTLPVKRLEEHNKGLSRYTSNKGTWKMVYLKKIPDKRTVLIREKQIKRVNMNYLRWLIDQESHIINQFF